MEDNKRRDFIKNVGVGAAALGTAGLAGVLSSCKGQKQEESKEAVKETPKAKTYTWKMATTWPPHFPMLGESADNIAKWVDEMSNGRLKIDVYGGGELVPPLGVFDAVSQGTVEMGHGAAYYWAGKSPAAQFFAAVPFGFNAQSINAWLLSGGGMELWEELYAKFNMKPFVAGNTGVQMGGWFNKEINSMDDLKGLKMRIPGLGGKVLAKAGGNAVLVAGGEIYTNLDRGVIDATEWVGPYHDLKMGFYKAAKYYYYPGWHECGTALECMVNLNAWNELPDDLKAIVEAATYKSNMWMLSEFEAKNNDALKTLINEHKVQLKQFPEEVLKELKKLAHEVLEEVAASDPMSRKVYDSFLEFQKNIYAWNKVTEEPYQKLKYL
ncbi:TRAP transporter substrate-binding protein [Desulfospira joergensenii]|uniref:TRAP transporter substrate-binding protein n=1 Tax=Desulfospira joergensenii TaxID=53329 RepID=UPI0003B6F1AD|nr:TRAP transporter substrate-binding protein DctP [Desulfospira joergensenii]